MSKRRRVLIFDSVLDNIFNSREWLPGTRFFCNYKTFNNPHKAGDVRQLHAHLHSGPHAFLKDRDAAEVVAVGEDRHRLGSEEIVVPEADQAQQGRQVGLERRRAPDDERHGRQHAR